MSHSHLNNSPQFFDNNHNNIECSSVPSCLHQEQHLFQSYAKLNDTQNLLNDLRPSQNTTFSTPDKFYQQYRRIYFVSFNLQIQKQRLKNLVLQLQRRISKIQEKRIFQSQLRQKDQKILSSVKHDEEFQQSKNRRSRRIDQQIYKKYECNVQKCRRVYSSESSLHQHIKLKHPELITKYKEEGKDPSQHKNELMQSSQSK